VRVRARACVCVCTGKTDQNGSVMEFIYINS